MAIYTDQLGNHIILNNPPKRIISLVPSQTELLYSLGLHDEVVGITRFCIHPDEWFKNKQKVGGTKQFNFDAIHSLQPDLIIGNKEENYKEGIEELQKHYPVWMSDIFNLQDSLDMMYRLGEITQRVQVANTLTEQIKSGFARLQEQTNRNLTIAYFIWRKPYMVAAQNTFIDSMITAAGWQNCFADQERYPEITLEQLKQKQPDVIFLSSEPYSFKEMHKDEFQQVCPNAKVVLVDGELFSWYGSRLLHTPEYLIQLNQQLV